MVLMLLQRPLKYLTGWSARCQWQVLISIAGVVHRGCQCDQQHLIISSYLVFCHSGWCLLWRVRHVSVSTQRIRVVPLWVGSKPFNRDPKAARDSLSMQPIQMGMRERQLKSWLSGLFLKTPSQSLGGRKVWPEFEYNPCQPSWGFIAFVLGSSKGSSSFLLKEIRSQHSDHRKFFLLFTGYTSAKLGKAPAKQAMICNFWSLDSYYGCYLSLRQLFIFKKAEEFCLSFSYASNKA